MTNEEESLLLDRVEVLSEALMKLSFVIQDVYDEIDKLKENKDERSKHKEGC